MLSTLYTPKEKTIQKRAAAKCDSPQFGDPDENRTRVTAVKGRCLNRLTTGPNIRAV